MQYVEFMLTRPSTGAALPHAQLTVYHADTTTLAALYDINGNSLANPVAADSTGKIGFAAANGVYDYVDPTGLAPTIRRQAFYDLGGLDTQVGIAVSSATAAAASAAAVPALSTALTNESYARTARITFASPLVIDGGTLLVPAAYRYSARVGVFEASTPPDTGTSASAYWPIDLTAPAGQEARIYYNYDEALAERAPFAITTDVPFVSDERKVIIATVRDGFVTAAGGMPIVGDQYGGMVFNLLRFGQQMDKAQRLLGTTAIGDITDSALLGLGFSRGAFNADTLKPGVGGDVPALDAGDSIFIRGYVQTSVDLGFGAPAIRFYDASGVVVGSPYPMTLERVLSARAAAYSLTGNVPAGAVVWRMCIESPAGQTLGITGLQFGFGQNAQWIARDDYIAPTVPPRSGKPLQAVSTRFKTMAGAAVTGYTRNESRLQAYTPQGSVHGMCLVFGNFYVGANGVGETPGPNAITIAAAVEPPYSPQVAVPVTFGGRKQVVIDPGAIVISDPIPGLMFDPNQASVGGTFFVRTTVTVSAGGAWPQGYYAFVDGEACYDSNSSTTQVYGTGALTAPTGGQPSSGGYGPLAAIGRTEAGQVSIVWHSDSIGDGTGDATVSLIDGYIARAMQSVNGAVIPQVRMSRGSDTILSATLRSGWLRRSMYEYGTHGLIAMGTNDIAQGATFSDLQARLTEISVAMRMRGMKVIASTLFPRTTSSDSWATTTAQAPVSGFGVGETRDQFNAWIKNYANGAIDYWYDPNELVESTSRPGVWNTNGAANYPTTDGIHPTTYFHVLAAQVLTRLLKTLSVPESYDSMSGFVGGPSPTVTKSTIGLAAVDNTSDVSKPISTPQASAFAARPTTALLSTTAGAGLAGFSHGATYDPGSHGAKSQQVVNVHDDPFLAVGDGIADDTVAVMAAITEINRRGGGEVQFSAGKRYLVNTGSTSLAHSFPNVWLTTSAPGAATIVNGSASQYAFTWGNTSTMTYGGGIRGLAFASQSGVLGSGVLIQKVGQFRLDALRFHNSPSKLATGIKISGCSQFMFTNNEAQACSTAGMYFANCIDGYLANNRSDANEGLGIWYDGCQGMYTINCTAYYNATGWKLASATPSSQPNENNFFVTCVGDTSASYNWVINDSINSFFTSPWGSSQISSTVNVYAAGFIISGKYSRNLFLDNPIALFNNSHGIQIYDAGGDTTPTHIHITNPMCGTQGVFGSNGNGQGGSGFGLTMNGACDHIRIAGGQFLNNASGSIGNTSGGTDIVIADNPVGFVTSSQGQASIAVGTSSIVVPHGLGTTPGAGNITLTPLGSRSASGITEFWVSPGPTSTSFTVNTNTNVTGTGFQFAWQARGNGA